MQRNRPKTELAAVQLAKPQVTVDSLLAAMTSRITRRPSTRPPSSFAIRVARPLSALHRQFRVDGRGRDDGAERRARLLPAAPRRGSARREAGGRLS